MKKINKIKCILIDFEIADKTLDEAAKEISLLSCEEYKGLTDVQLISVSYIEKKVCEYYGFNVDYLHKKSKKPGSSNKAQVQCRNMVHFLSEEILEVSSATMGKYYRRDRSTMVKNLKRFKFDIDHYPDPYSDLTIIRKSLLFR